MVCLRYFRVDMFNGVIGGSVPKQPVKAVLFENKQLIGERTHGNDRVASECAYLNMTALNGGRGFNRTPLFNGASAARKNGIIQPVRIGRIAGRKQSSSVHRQKRNGNV